MKKDNAEKLKFVDALAKDVRYAVLTKAGRVQVLARPSAKQLRKRGKRGWHLYHAVEGENIGIGSVMDIVRQAIAEVESPAVNGGPHKDLRPKKVVVHS
jgi:hypothetical protein